VLPTYSFPASVPALTCHPVIHYAVSKLPPQAGAIRLRSDSFNYFISRQDVIFCINFHLWNILVCYTIQLMHYSLLRNSSQADHQQTRTPNTHRWHKHAATYCVIIQTQRTQISGRNSNGTNTAEDPLKMVVKKRPKHVGVLYLQTLF
jgi:hypothetical protein